MAIVGGEKSIRTGLLTGLFLAVALQAPARGSDAARSGTKRPPSISSLLRNYRLSRKQPDEHKAVVEQILQRGKEGATRLQKEVERELRAAYSPYRREFCARARWLGLRKYRAANKRNIAVWQEQVNCLRRDERLSKERVKSQGLPALNKLREALTVSPTEVLASTAPLAAKREALVALIAIRKRCISAQGKDPPAPAETDPEKTLVKNEEGMAMMGMAFSGKNRRIVEGIWRQRGNILLDEAIGLIDLNVMRSLLNLGGLRLNIKLCNAARGHSRDMAERKFFAHVSPVAGKATMTDRARLAGTTANGENLQMGSPTAPGANESLFLSPGHHKNMLRNSFTQAGLGHHKRYWTQMFGL